MTLPSPKRSSFPTQLISSIWRQEQISQLFIICVMYMLCVYMHVLICCYIYTCIQLISSIWRHERIHARASGLFRPSWLAQSEGVSEYMHVHYPFPSSLFILSRRSRHWSSNSHKTFDGMSENMHVHPGVVVPSRVCSVGVCLNSSRCARYVRAHIL